MKKILIAFTLIFVQLINSHLVLAETPISDQTEIKLLIKKLYAANNFYEFEAGTFGAKYNKNGHKIVEGKYDRKRHCQLMAEFLVKEAIIKEKPGNQVCEIFTRYPLLDDEERSPYVNRNVPSPPIPQIKSPVVSGEKAKIQVLLPTIDANVMYYLRKQPEGWRIYRVESSNSDATIENIHTRENRSQLDRIDIFPPEK